MTPQLPPMPPVKGRPIEDANNESFADMVKRHSEDVKKITRQTNRIMILWLVCVIALTTLYVVTRYL